MAINGLTDNRFLLSATQGIQQIFEESANYLARTRPLIWLDRLPMVDAEDGELMGRFTSKLYAADIIADNQKATVHQGGKLQLVLNDLAVFKHGESLSASDIQKLRQLNDHGGLTVKGRDDYTTWINNMGARLLYGVRQRQNMLAASMFLDNFDYDRWGIRAIGSVWGMPSDLKVSASVALSSDSGITANASATPINDLFAIDEIDATTGNSGTGYGLGAFNRMTLSSKAFRFIVQTTEFSNKAFLQMGAGFAPAILAISNSDKPQMINLVNKILDKEIVLDDATYTVQNNDGSEVTTRYLPENKIVLDRTSNTSSECDFGNGTVTESIVAGLTGQTMVSANPRFQMPAGSKGPLGYFTGPADLNPPTITGWGVARGWPRRHRPECSAIYTAW